MRFFVLPLLLAAAASAEVFQFVGQHGHGSSVYGVRGAVTVGAHQLTGEKTALEYNGTFAIQQVREGEFLAKFTQFTLGKYDKINRNIKDETFGDLKPEEQRLVKALREGGDYEQEMQKPVKFYMKEGQVVRMEAGKEHHQWSLNIFRGVFTLLQNQVQKPANLAVPFIDYKYEDGITGNCKVQYQILSQPQYGATQGVYNVTKTKNYKDCLGRPVYMHLKDTQRGCAGVCDNHRPENFLGEYEEEHTDYDMKPTPGCPVHQQRKDTLVTVQTVTKYNVSKGYLDEARSEHTDIYHLFGGRIQVFTNLYLYQHFGQQGPQIGQPQNVEVYETLQQRLPREEDELDIPIYALMKEHTKHGQYPQYFQKHFEAVIREMHQIQEHQKQGQGEHQTYDTPAYLVELIQAVSGMTEEELKKTIPGVVRQQQPKQLSEEEHLRRQLWIELIGKAGSKSAVKLAVEFIKNQVFTPTEARRVLQDISGFQSYPDTEMIEQVLGLCMQGQGQGHGHGLTSTGKATACVAAGKIISKGCNSKVYQWAQKHEQHKMLINNKRQMVNEGGKQDYETEPEAEEYRLTMGHFPIQSQYLCTPEKLQQYVDRLYQGLQHATDFKTVVAYINGLAHMQKPEVIPKLIDYVHGTADNMKHVKQQGEDEQEAIEFVRRVAIMSLRYVAMKYPKEVNPIVRVVYENTTEPVQTRIVAFDVWMNTQPAQWEVEKVMQVANKDTSLELTHYVYTALRTAMHAQEPCYQLLAQRIRAAWTQIRPFYLGMYFSHLRSKGYYSTAENFGIRGIWKMIASNTTIIPAYTEAKIEQIRGPYLKTLFGAKLLVKGGDKIWEQLVGHNGFLEHLSRAVGGQPQQIQQETQQETQRLLKDIAQGMGMNQYHDETPKAVLFWRLFAGEAVIPIDAEYIKELKQEFLQTVTKLGQQGVTGHYFRVFVPTKAFHVEPTTIGLPIVHSTIHPIVMSVRYENIKLHYNNQQGRVAPHTFELTGTVHPTVLSFRQARVFVGEKEGDPTPTMKVTDIKEFNFRFAFRVGYVQPEHRFHVQVKPVFERVFHSGHCTELKLEGNNIIDEQPRTRVVDYGKCIKSLYEPIYQNMEIGGDWTGMVLRLAGVSHQPWSGLPIFGSRDARREGLVGAMINRLSNKGMKHHAISLYLEADKQQPINEWTAIVDIDSNLEQLSKIALNQQVQKVQKVKVEYKPRQQPINGELQQVIRKVETLLQQGGGDIDDTTIERQMLIKIEGRYQGQPKRTINVAMKKISNFEKTEQKYALAVEHKESKKGLELYANMSYPKIGSPFRYDPTYINEDERMNGTLVAKFLGQQEQIYRVKFQAVKSDEQKKESEYEWFEARCLAEQKAGKTMTDTCKKAILKDNSLDSMKMIIELPRNVDPQAKAVAYKVLDMIKYKYYPQMQSEIAGHLERVEQLKKYQTGEQKIYMSANATRQFAWSLLYNVRVEMPLENVTFSQIRLPGLRPVHMQLSAKHQLQHVMFRGQKENYCILGDKSVRTYDNVTFGLDVQKGCEYVLTRDQTPGNPDFTVTFQVTKPETFGKKIRVQLYNQLIEFEPFTTTDRVFQVVINGHENQFTFDKPVVFEYGHGKRVHINAYDTSNPHHAPVVTLYTESHELGLHFDGHTVRIFVADQYKGKVNGICGNNDNERHNEFIGPKGHEYEHSNEFIASYGIGQQCKTPVPNTNDKLMETLNREVEQIRRQELIKKEKLRQQMHDEYQQQQQQQQQQHQGQHQKHNQFWMEEQQEQLWGNQQPHHSMEQQWSTQQEREVLRTTVSIENGHICFSSRPVAHCKPGYKKQGILRTERVESICLDQNHEAAVDAVQEIRAGRPVNVATLEPYQKGRLFTMHDMPKCERDD